MAQWRAVLTTKTLIKWGVCEWKLSILLCPWKSQCACRKHPVTDLGVLVLQRKDSGWTLRPCLAVNSSIFSYMQDILKDTHGSVLSHGEWLNVLLNIDLQHNCACNPPVNYETPRTSSSSQTSMSGSKGKKHMPASQWNWPACTQLGYQRISGARSTEQLLFSGWPGPRIV